MPPTLKADLLSFIEQGGKVTSPEIFARFAMVAKRVIDLHLTELIEERKIIRGGDTYAPVRVARAVGSAASDTGPVLPPPEPPRRPKARTEPGAAPAAKPARPAPPKPAGPTIAERIIALFGPGAILSRASIFEALSDCNQGSVYAMLTKMSARKALVQYDRLYWLPGEPPTWAAFELAGATDISRIPADMMAPDMPALPPSLECQPADLAEMSRAASEQAQSQPAKLADLEAHDQAEPTLATIAAVATTVAARAATHEPPPLPGKVDVDRLVVADLLSRAGGGDYETAALVAVDFMARSDFGLAKYGTRLQTHNGRDGMIDAYQEMLDYLAYIRCRIEEINDRGGNDYAIAELYRKGLHLAVSHRELIDDVQS